MNRVSALFVHRWTISGLAAVLALFLAAVPAWSGETGGDIVLRCRWQCPNTRAMMETTFAGNPAVIMLPGETLEVTARLADGLCRVATMKDGQPYREDTILNFTAPTTPGAYYVPLLLSAGTASRQAEMCVIVPHRAAARKTDRGAELSADGQAIGHYSNTSRSGNAKVKANPDSYQPPALWVRVTADNADFEIAPGLRLGDLVVATEDTGLKHIDIVPVQYPMWNAIVTVRDALPAIGVSPSCFRLLSVFRAPGYNREVGSNAFGRHIYGDAFDFYIEAGNTGKAIDLNRDGKLDRRDAYPLVALVEDLQADGRIPMGGVGVYSTIGGDHEVTMHVDLRGHRATWGFLTTAGGKRGEFSWQSKRFAHLDAMDEAAAAERAAKENRAYRPPRREPLQ